MIRSLAFVALNLLAQDGGVSGAPDGPHERLHENGHVAVRGGYRDGLLQGVWETFYADGTPRTVGEFNEGRRTGRWRFFHSGGELAAEGRYRLGMRDRKWVYLDPAGEKVEAESGLYRTESELYENRQKHYMVEELDERRHGRWISWWESGVVQLEGEYQSGVRGGVWRLRHVDGSLEPDFVTGYYEGGERVDAPPSGVGRPFSIAEEEAAKEPATTPDLSRLPRLKRPPSVKLSQRAKHKEWIARLLDDPEEKERAVAEQMLLQYGRDAVADVLNRFAELDRSDPRDVEHGRRLNALLKGLCKGRGFDWTGEGEDGEADDRELLRWFAWWELCKDDDVFWSRLASNDVPEDLLSLEIVDGLLAVPAIARSSGPVSSTAEFPTVRSDLFRVRARARPSPARERNIERALLWLANHQSPNGSWDCDDFTEECHRLEHPECDGPGIAAHDVGVTGLALAAFLASGNTTDSGDHAAVVRSAVRWLLGQQDDRTGLFGEKVGHAYIYNHAIATTALAEVALFTDAPEVEEALRQAVVLILSARNPKGAWRYDVPPIGDNDTSVTGWMVHALHAAQEAGVEVDPVAFEAALEWFDKVTQRDTGRTGYDAVGSLSARVAGMNEHFPPEQGESMTAVALFSRFLLGRTPSRDDIMVLQAELILSRPPVWAPADFDCDMYYWYHGTNAMVQMGGKYQLAWDAALSEALVESQSDDLGSGLYGSWDPVGPWGYSGGRVYSTALLALCLQAEFRYPRYAR